MAAAGRRELGGEGVAQALGGAVLGVSERAEALEQNEAMDALGPGAGEQRGHTGAERVAEQGELLPAEGLGDGGDIGDVVDEVVGRAGSSLREAVAGEVEGDDAAARQQGREGVEGGGVVEPAVHGEHGHAVVGAVDAGGQRQAGDLDRALGDGHGARFWRKSAGDAMRAGVRTFGGVRAHGVWAGGPRCRMLAPAAA